MGLNRLLNILLTASAVCLVTKFVQGTSRDGAEGEGRGGREGGGGVCGPDSVSDVAFLIDSSNSVWRADFRRQLAFLHDVTDRFTIGPDNVRVAVSTYSVSSETHFLFHKPTTKSTLRALVGNIRHHGGRDNGVGDAIRHARLHMFGTSNRTQPSARNVPLVIVVITDGPLKNRTAEQAEARRAKQDDIRIFVVGVGEYADPEEAKIIASQPDDYYTLLVDSFANLAKIRELLATRICQIANSVREDVPSTTSTPKESQTIETVQTESVLGVTSLPLTVSNKVAVSSKSAPLNKAASTKAQSTRKATGKVLGTRKKISPDRPSVVSSSAYSTFTATFLKKPTSAGVVNVKPAAITAAAAAGDVSSRADTLASESTTTISSIKYYGRIGPTNSNAAKSESLDLITQTSSTPDIQTLRNPFYQSAFSYRLKEVHIPTASSHSDEELKVYVKESDSTLYPTADLASATFRDAAEHVIHSSINSGFSKDAQHVTRYYQQSYHILRQLTENDQENSNHRHPDDGEETERLVEALESGRQDSTDDHLAKKSNRSQQWRPSGHGGQHIVSDDLEKSEGVSKNETIFWRLDENGTLAWYRLISPGVFQRGSVANYKPSRPESNCPDESTSRALEDSRSISSRTRGRLVRGRVIKGRENAAVSPAAHGSDHRDTEGIKDRSRYIGHQTGFHGSIGDRIKSHEALHPRSQATGFWRFNEQGKLMWQNYSVTPHPGNPTEEGLSQNELKQHAYLTKPSQDIDRITVAGTPSNDDKVSSPVPTLPGNRERYGYTRWQNHTDTNSNSSSTRTGFWRYDGLGRRVWVTRVRHEHGSRRPNEALNHFLRVYNGSSSLPLSGSSSFVPPVESDGRSSYGYFTEKNGKTIWMEYVSPGNFREVDETELSKTPNRIRHVLPPQIPRPEKVEQRRNGCKGSNEQVGRTHYIHDKVNRNARTEETFISRIINEQTTKRTNISTPFKFNDAKNIRQMLETLKEEFSGSSSVFGQHSGDGNMPQQINSSRLHELYLLLNKIGNNASFLHRYNRSFSSSSSTSSGRQTGIILNGTAEQLKWIKDVYEINATSVTGEADEKKEPLLGQEIIPKGVREVEKKKTSEDEEDEDEEEEEEATVAARSLMSTTPDPTRERGIRRTVTTRLFITPSVKNRNREKDKTLSSVRNKANSVPITSKTAKKTKKPIKGCTARRRLDLVFVVDPRAKTKLYTRRLWQLAYGIVLRLKMDNDRIRVRFIPELEQMIEARTNGAAATVTHKVPQKSVSELIRRVSAMLTENKNRESGRKSRRIGIYITDGPSGSIRELTRSVKEVKLNRKIEFYVVGIGEETNPVELELIADVERKGRKHLYRLVSPRTSDISDAATELATAFCS